MPPQKVVLVHTTLGAEPGVTQLLEVINALRFPGAALLIGLFDVMILRRELTQLLSTREADEPGVTRLSDEIALQSAIQVISRLLADSIPLQSIRWSNVFAERAEMVELRDGITRQWDALRVDSLLRLSELVTIQAAVVVARLLADALAATPDTLIILRGLTQADRAVIGDARFVERVKQLFDVLATIQEGPTEFQYGLEVVESFRSVGDTAADIVGRFILRLLADEALLQDRRYLDRMNLLASTLRSLVDQRIATATKIYSDRLGLLDRRQAELWKTVAEAGLLADIVTFSVFFPPDRLLQDNAALTDVRHAETSHILSDVIEGQDYVLRAIAKVIVQVGELTDAIGALFVPAVSIFLMDIIPQRDTQLLYTLHKFIDELSAGDALGRDLAKWIGRDGDEAIRIFSEVVAFSVGGFFAVALSDAVDALTDQRVADFLKVIGEVVRFSEELLLSSTALFPTNIISQLLRDEAGAFDMLVDVAALRYRSFVGTIERKV